MKKIMHHAILLSSLAAPFRSGAQGYMESQIPVPSREGISVVYGLSQFNNNEPIPYERISGSPFWKDNFQMATLFNSKDQALITAPVKLNLYSNEIYFLNNKGEVRVPDPGLVSKVIFHDTGTVKKALAVFENGFAEVAASNPNAQNTSYVQIMNSGDAQLLKYTKVNLMAGDSLFGTLKRFYFSSQFLYFLNTKNGKNIKLRKLNAETVTDPLQLDAEERNWIRSNKIQLKKEEEVIRFLNYLNAHRAS